MKNANLAETHGLKNALLASVTGTPVVGERVSLEKANRVALVIEVAAAASAVLSLALKQHNAASAGDSKALATLKPLYHKVNTKTAFTKVEVTAARSTIDLFALADVNKAVFVIDIQGTELDINNGFTHFSAEVTGDATARIVSATYVLDTEFAPAYEIAL